MEKRGQFFLLAAVIISVVVLSLSVVTNRAIVNEEPGSFYDYTYEVNREIGAVMDYDIYTDFDSTANLDDFVSLLAEDIEKKNPDADFVLVYGEGSDLLVNKHGTEDVSANGEVVPDSSNDIKTNVCIHGSCKEILNKVSGSGGISLATPNDSITGEIVIEFGDAKYKFPISNNKQVIFMMKKDVGDERFVTVG